MGLSKLFSRLGSSKAAQTTEDYFSFTSGRWLWDEEKQLKKHYRKFNVEALQEAATKVAGAKRCVSMKKISETGGNRVFRLKMDNRKVVIAKMPYERATSLRLASEAATMDFAAFIGIPVPKLLAYRINDDVGLPYILMQEAQGELLEKTWDQTHPDNKAEVITQIADILNKLASVSFSHIGSIFFAADNIAGTVPAIVEGPLSEQIKQRYAIGPTIDLSYWDDRTTSRGPWKTAREYWQSIADRELTYLETAPERKQKPLQQSPRGTREEHIDLWKRFALAGELLDSLEMLQPCLWHCAIKPENIFLYKGKISLLDWEGSWVQPLALSFMKPFFMFPKVASLEIPQGPPTPESMQIVIYHYLRYAWQQTWKLEKLDEPSYLLVQQLAYQAKDTWNFGAFQMRQLLIVLHSKWTEITGKPCPYEITEQDVERESAEGQSFELFMLLAVATMNFLGADGLVKTENFDKVVMIYANICNQILAPMEEGEAKQELAASLAWIKDLPKE